MPRTESSPKTSKSSALVYSPVARGLHWAVAALVFVTAPIGFIMVDRGARDIWDATTNNLYSTHKLIGLTILALMIVRLAYRVMHGAPAPEPTLTPVEKGVSTVVHWAIYLLLFAVPIGGYLGISYYPALDIFGVKVPGLVTPNEDTAKAVFKLHGYGAFLLLGLVAMHIGAAFMHGFVKKDGVMGRMIPGMKR
ncbi:MAG: cytochrome b [Hyphomicrobiaceae bacterium]